MFDWERHTMAQSEHPQAQEEIFTASLSAAEITSHPAAEFIELRTRKIEEARRKVKQVGSTS